MSPRSSISTSVSPDRKLDTALKCSMQSAKPSPYSWSLNPRSNRCSTMRFFTCANLKWSRHEILGAKLVPLRWLLLLGASCSLLSAYCLLPNRLMSSLTVGPLPRAFSQNQPAPPPVQPSPSPSPAPSPSPSPTPPPNLHQWGAVTSFHGLPSDRTHAIAQTEFGVTWFATDGGLARYDGRRTNAINAEGLPAGRILALKADESGPPWIGTDNGAARLANAKFEPIRETAGKVITAIITPQSGRALLASESGQIFDCQVKQSVASETTRSETANDSVSFAVKTIPDQPLPS